MEAKKKTYTDETIAGSKYILRFYELIMTLNSQKSILKNLLKELKQTFNTTKKIEIDLQIQSQIRQQVTNTTYIIDQIQTIYETLTRTIKLTDQQSKDKKEITKLYEHINTNIIPETKKIDDYTILINDFLISKSLKELLSNSKTIIEDVYGN